MPRPPALPPIARYAVALASVLAVWAAKTGADPFLHADQPVFLWFIGAVLFSAWYGGLGPGVFATVLSAAVADVVLFKPHYEPFVRNAGQYFQIALFGTIGGFTSIFCGRLRWSRAQFFAALSDADKANPDAAPPGELIELARLKRLEGEMGRVVAHADTLQDVFQGCVTAMVNHVGAAFARVWTLDEGGQTLVLRASAGLYTHLDGPHSRVPVGKFKIGLIASEKCRT